MKKLTYETLQQKLPHGSGIDGDWYIRRNAKNTAWFCTNAYHCMNENGFYDGWAPFTAKIYDNGEMNLVFHESGFRHKSWFYGLKDYLWETIEYSLFSKEVQK